MYLIYLLYATGIIPALYWAICWNKGWERSKCCWGRLHQPPALFGRALFGGQKLVAVTTTEPGRHHLGSFTHLISKQAPQFQPLLKSSALRAAVLVPYPWLYRFPYPQAPPGKDQQFHFIYTNRICNYITKHGLWCNKNLGHTYPLYQRHHPHHKRWHEHQSTHYHFHEQMKPKQDFPIRVAQEVPWWSCCKHLWVWKWKGGEEWEYIENWLKARSRRKKCCLLLLSGLGMQRQNQ